jgi:hypothetical protein
MESWRARLGVLAGRGDTHGPRVDEARCALSWWRARSSFIREMNLGEERVDALIELAWEPASADARQPGGGPMAYPSGVMARNRAWAALSAERP